MSRSYIDITKRATQKTPACNTTSRMYQKTKYRQDPKTPAASNKQNICKHGTRQQRVATKLQRQQQSRSAFTRCKIVATIRGHRPSSKNHQHATATIAVDKSNTSNKHHQKTTNKHKLKKQEI